MSIGTALIVALDGEWDVYRREELHAALLPAYDEPRVVLDLSAVSYADSTVLSELVRMRRHRLTQGLPSPSLVISTVFLRILTITHTQKLWPYYQTLQEALSTGKSPVCDFPTFDRS